MEVVQPGAFHLGHGATGENEPLPTKEESVMTDLLGGQEVWEETAHIVSTIQKEEKWTDDEVRQVLLHPAFKNKIRQLFRDLWPGAKSATTPEVATYIEEEHTVVKDVPSRFFRAQTLEFPSLLKTGKERISSETTLNRAEKLEGNNGIADAVWLLENQHLIPTKLRGKANIVFPGTLLLDSDGRLLVPYLDWDDDSWVLEFSWLDEGWSGQDCVVRWK